MDPHRQFWAHQQQRFRQCLFTKGKHQEAIELFFSQHAMIHASAMAESGLWSFEDEILTGLSQDQIRARPATAKNSIAWLLWHIARIEDVTINVLVAGQPQILEEADWVERLHLTRRDVGTSMSEAEVGEFSGQVDLTSLRAYRVAVGRRTREVVSSLSEASWREPIDPTNVQRLLAAGALAEAALELAHAWSGWKKTGMLTMPATRHSFTHLNEARTIRQTLTKPRRQTSKERPV